VRRSARCRRSGAIDPAPLSNAGRAVMAFPVIYGISPPLEFQFDVSAHTNSPGCRSCNSPAEGERAAAGVVLAGVSRYTDLATQVRQACGMADGWQRVDRVSYAKCAPPVTRRPAATTDRRLGAHKTASAMGASILRSACSDARTSASKMENSVAEWVRSRHLRRSNHNRFAYQSSGSGQAPVQSPPPGR